jgi:hypothetical protein
LPFKCFSITFQPRTLPFSNTCKCSVKWIIENSNLDMSNVELLSRKSSHLLFRVNFRSRINMQFWKAEKWAQWLLSLFRSVCRGLGLVRDYLLLVLCTIRSLFPHKRPTGRIPLNMKYFNMIYFAVHYKLLGYFWNNYTLNIEQWSFVSATLGYMKIFPILYFLSLYLNMW